MIRPQALPPRADGPAAASAANSADTSADTSAATPEAAAGKADTLPPGPR